MHVNRPFPPPESGKGRDTLENRLVVRLLHNLELLVDVVACCEHRSVQQADLAQACAHCPHSLEVAPKYESA